MRHTRWYPLVATSVLVGVFFDEGNWICNMVTSPGHRGCSQPSVLVFGIFTLASMVALTLMRLVRIPGRPRKSEG